MSGPEMDQEDQWILEVRDTMNVHQREALTAVWRLGWFAGRTDGVMPSENPFLKLALKGQSNDSHI